MSQAQRGPGGPGLHTAGIYADMTVDGPEIGTLVVVLDRAKNLPNRRTMGKQDPYCAARLGKEAKKTDTDKRGGQTPRWDQELRFTVHDSPDYNNLKLSVFNDDKKTDLIGETLISLEDILLPGGGQGDQWHPLNCKGRYAGEIRIELTYYDSRPRSERPREKGRKHTPTDLSTTDQQSSMTGVRPPPIVKRRPLPTDPTGSSSAYPPSPHMISVPDSASRGYHIPPTQDSLAQEYSSQQQSLHENPRHTSQSSASSGNVRSHSGASRPLPSPLDYSPSSADVADTPEGHDFSENNYYESSEVFDGHQEGHDFDDYDMPVTDDPYALAAVHSQDYLTDFNAPHVVPPRNQRVLELSGSPVPRPSPNIPLSHAHSAPSLGTNEHYQEMDHDFGEAQHEWRHDHTLQSSPIPNNMYSNSPEFTQPYSMSPYDSSQSHDFHEVHVPPAPPAHRNSAPAVTRFGNRPTSAQATRLNAQPLHVPRAIVDFHGNPVSAINPRHERDTRHGMNSHMYSAQQNQGANPSSIPNLHSRHQSTDGLSSQYREPRRGTQPVYPDEYQLSSSAGTPVFPQRRSLGAMTDAGGHYQQQEQQHPRESGFSRFSPPGPSKSDPRQIYENRNLRTPRTNPPLQAGSINSNRGQSSTLYQTHNTTPQNASLPSSQPPSQSKVPYSPDSFTVFNPQHSNPSTPNAGIVLQNQRELSPMYNSPKPSSPQNALQSPVPAVIKEAPIIGTNGKVKDPTDHLPPSSYAPEPERKGNRPSIVITQRNRFGPREARTTAVTTRQQNSAPTTPTSDRNPGGAINVQHSPRHNHMQQQPGISSSPLAPAQDISLNAQNFVSNGTPQYGPQRYAGHGFGYDRVEVFGPPVPAKIPLDGRFRAAQNGRTVAGLGRDMAALNLDGTVDEMGNVYGGRGGATRPRRSRFGA